MQTQQCSARKLKSIFRLRNFLTKLFFSEYSVSERYTWCSQALSLQGLFTTLPMWFPLFLLLLRQFCDLLRDVIPQQIDGKETQNEHRDAQK